MGERPEFIQHPEVVDGQEMAADRVEEAFKRRRLELDLAWEELRLERERLELDKAKGDYEFALETRRRNFELDLELRVLELEGKRVDLELKRRSLHV